MALAWWSLPLLLLAALVLAEQFALLQREGKIYLKQLPLRPRWRVSPDELPRLRRALARWAPPPPVRASPPLALPPSRSAKARKMG